MGRPKFEFDKWKHVRCKGCSCRYQEMGEFTRIEITKRTDMSVCDTCMWWKV